MNGNPDVIRFVATETVSYLNEAIQPLLLTSAAARAAKSKEFDDAFARWCMVLASSPLMDRRRLLASRKPPAWPAGASWPQNANVLRGLWKCFDRSYQTAYGEDCRR